MFLVFAPLAVVVWPKGALKRAERQRFLTRADIPELHSKTGPGWGRRPLQCRSGRRSTCGRRPVERSLAAFSGSHPNETCSDRLCVLMAWSAGLRFKPVCLQSNQMEAGGSSPAELKALKNGSEHVNIRNPEPLTPGDAQCWPELHGGMRSEPTRVGRAGQREAVHPAASPTTRGREALPERVSSITCSLTAQAKSTTCPFKARASR